jgi:hypothetical protein
MDGLGGLRRVFKGPLMRGRRWPPEAGSSILPHKSWAPLAGLLLRATDGRRIRCWGSKQLQLSLHGTSYSWQFLLADVKFPILGVGFLRHFGLLSRCGGRQTAAEVHAAAAAGRQRVRNGGGAVGMAERSG